MQKTGACIIIILCVIHKPPHCTLLDSLIIHAPTWTIPRRFRIRIKYNMVTEWVRGCGMGSTGVIFF